VCVVDRSRPGICGVPRGTNDDADRAILVNLVLSDAVDARFRQPVRYG